MRINHIAINRAKELALRCNFKGYGVGAVFLIGDNVVSEGWAHVSHIRLAEMHSLHAEIHALGRARHLNLAGSVAYVATIRRRTNSVCLSKPCIACAIALRSAGINYVVYTVEHDGCSILDLESDLRDLKVYKRGSES